MLRLPRVTALDLSEQLLYTAIGTQVAQALDRARLRQSEHASRRSLALIAEASERLSQSLDYERILHELAGMAVPRVADHAIVDVVEEGGVIRRLAVVSTDDEVAAGLERYPPAIDGTNPIAVAIREGRPRIFDTMGAAIREAASNDEHRAMIERLNGLSAMVVPL